MNKLTILAVLATVGLLTTGCGKQNVAQTVPAAPVTGLTAAVPTPWTTYTDAYVVGNPYAATPMAPTTWSSVVPPPDEPFWGLGRGDTSTGTPDFWRHPRRHHHRHHPRRRPPFTGTVTVPTTGTAVTYMPWPNDPRQLAMGQVTPTMAPAYPVTAQLQPTMSPAYPITAQVRPVPTIVTATY